IRSRMKPRGGGRYGSSRTVSDDAPVGETANGLNSVSGSSAVARVTSGPLRANRLPTILSAAFSESDTLATFSTAVVVNRSRLADSILASFSPRTAAFPWETCPRAEVDEAISIAQIQNVILVFIQQDPTSSPIGDESNDAPEFSARRRVKSPCRARGRGLVIRHGYRETTQIFTTSEFHYPSPIRLLLSFGSGRSDGAHFGQHGPRPRQIAQREIEYRGHRCRRERRQRHGCCCRTGREYLRALRRG